MKHLYYPVIFHAEDVGFSVFVPDIDGCFTQGTTMDEALEMAHDAIGLMLEDMTTIPKPSLPTELNVDKNDFVVVVPFDKTAYLRKHETKAVKKTLTIPSWLNVMAEEQHVNFSSLLQSALKEKLNIAE